MSLHTQILLHGDITEAETETERQYKRLPSTSRSSLPTLRSDRCDRSRRPAPNLRSRGRSRPAAPGAASRGRQPPAARATRKAAGKGKMEGKSPRGTRGLSATGCSFGWVQNPPPDNVNWWVRCLPGALVQRNRRHHDGILKFREFTHLTLNPI